MRTKTNVWRRARIGQTSRQQHKMMNDDIISPTTNDKKKDDTCHSIDGVNNDDLVSSMMSRRGIDSLNPLLSYMGSHLKCLSVSNVI